MATATKTGCTIGTGSSSGPRTANCTALTALLWFGRMIAKRYRHGRRHRSDGPAVMGNATTEWRQMGQVHQDDGPARTTEAAQQEWYSAGELYRDGGPAIVRPDGAQEWYSAGGTLHREGGPAIDRPDGSQEWHQTDSCTARTTSRPSPTPTAARSGGATARSAGTPARQSSPPTEWRTGGTAPC